MDGHLNLGSFEKEGQPANTQRDRPGRAPFAPLLKLSRLPENAPHVEIVALEVFHGKWDKKALLRLKMQALKEAVVQARKLKEHLGKLC